MRMRNQTFYFKARLHTLWWHFLGKDVSSLKKPSHRAKKLRLLLFSWIFHFLRNFIYLLQTPLNLVFKLKRNYINQDETKLLLYYWLLYILCLVSYPLPMSLSHVLFLVLYHHLISSSLHYITSLLWNEVNLLYYPSSKIASLYLCDISVCFPR